MKNLSICQKYLLCTLNTKGKLPSLCAESPVCVLAGGLIDLILSNTIVIGKDKKLSIAGELHAEHQHLNSLYCFIKESKPMKVDKLASEYAFTFSDTRVKQLINDVGESIAKLGYASIEEGGLFGKTQCFIPNANAVEWIIQNMRAELLEHGMISDEIIALVSLMDKSNQIKTYFSKHEKAQLTVRLKEIKSSDSNKLIKEMVDYIDTMLVVIATMG